MKKQFRVLPIIMMLLFTGALYAQEASILGIVFDKESKEPLIGATVGLDNSDKGTFTDFDGNYILRGLVPGIYDLVISYIGYHPTRITGVELKAGERQKLDILLTSNSVLFEEITVVEYRQTNTVEAVLLEIKQAKQVVSGVSSQQIIKSQDNNAAQIMQRIPGVTIVDNRFVMVRGLSERYNNVMINNVVAPSTEVDKRTFSFDLLSSGALDRLLVYKSGSADLPGDFAGGVMKIHTIDHAGDNFFRINLGLGYRAGTTGQSFFQSQGSRTDFLGFDNGFRNLPSNIPDTRTIQQSPRNSDIRRDAAHLLPNNWNPREMVAAPDHTIGFSFGRNMTLGGRKLTTVNQVNLSSSYQTYQRDFYRYFEWEDRNIPILERFRYDDSVYEKENKLSVLSNWKLRLSDRSYITFKNLFNQIGENETNIRRGTDFLQRPEDDQQNYLLGYRSRTIYMGQFEGVHEISDRSKLHWVAGGSFLRENEPDLRRFRTFRPQGQSDLPFTMQAPPSSNLFDTGRYFGDLTEFSANQGLDYSWSFLGVREAKSSIKTGYYVDYRNREFNSRYFSFLYPGFFDPNEFQRIANLPLDQVFAKENIKTVDGWVLEEGTRNQDSYTGSNLLTAGYISTELPMGAFDVATGVRLEYNMQQLSSRNDFEVIEVNNPVLSVLPFINTAYNLNDRSLIRLAYSRTVNRPEFRELAPFLFYDYNLDAGRFGNPNLQVATIDNIDLRYELYMRPGETFNVGAFYKNFTNPIEDRTIITTEQPSFTYINAASAQNYGLEVEFRKSLSGMTNSAFLDRFSLNMNASIIWSEVDLGFTSSVQERVRPLQGQSPYIVNMAVYYDDQAKGFSASAVYNIFGNRIFSVGDVLFPTIYELSRNSLDLTMTKRVGSRSTIKIGIQNLFDAPYRFFQDSNRNEKIDSDDDPIFTFRRGQLVSVNYSFDISK